MRLRERCPAFSFFLHIFFPYRGLVRSAISCETSCDLGPPYFSMHTSEELFAACRRLSFAVSLGWGQNARRCGVGTPGHGGRVPHPTYCGGTDKPQLAGGSVHSCMLAEIVEALLQPRSLPVSGLRNHGRRITYRLPLCDSAAAIQYHRNYYRAHRTDRTNGWVCILRGTQPSLFPCSGPCG